MRSVLCSVRTGGAVWRRATVDKLKRRWKEQKERKRHWYLLREGAKLVDAPDLTSPLKELAKQREKLTIIEEMRSASSSAAIHGSERKRPERKGGKK